jgi:hypothetical protein
MVHLEHELFSAMFINPAVWIVLVFLATAAKASLGRPNICATNPSHKFKLVSKQWLLTLIKTP